ncbi:H(+)-transporting V1 sector ATPase subunit A [Mortierella sp. AD032]|nr:H(+)-transporting V1 sector ATPase subunit A [Mortierella sp. AD032]
MAKQKKFKSNKTGNPFWHLIVLLGMGTRGSKKVDSFFGDEEHPVMEHFLCGLVDSDGSVESQTNRQMRTTTNEVKDQEALIERTRYKHAVFTNTNQAIIQGVLRIARNLGIKTSVRVSDANVRNGRNNSASSYVYFSPCAALSRALSICSVELKHAPAPPSAPHHSVEYYFTIAPATIRGTIKTLAEQHRPHRHARPTNVSKQYVDGFSTPIIAAIAADFKSFGVPHASAQAFAGVHNATVSDFLLFCSEHEDPDRFYRRQILEYA